MKERETDEDEAREENGKKEDDEVKDVEKGEAGSHEELVGNHNHQEFHFSRMQRLNPSNPLRLAVNNATRVGTPSPSQPIRPAQPARPARPAQPLSTPTPQVSYLEFA